MFGEGMDDHCNCDQFDGVHHCKHSCGGYCNSADAGTVQVLPVSGQLTIGSIDAVCSPNTGRHQWFKFEAKVGTMYMIWTDVDQGGLTSTFLHLHALDTEQTELASAKSWMCPTGDANGLASCIMWACTASGAYGVRVGQQGGSGAFGVGVRRAGTLGEITSRAGLRLDYQGREMPGPAEGCTSGKRQQPQVVGQWVESAADAGVQAREDTADGLV